jgi:hypothetical protein
MSLRLPAKEKDTDDAIDHPPAIQVILVTSSSAVPIWTMTAVTRVQPIPTGAIKEVPRNY